MVAAIVVFGILSLITVLVRTDKLDEKKRRIIKHVIGMSIFLFLLIISILDMIENNFSEKSVVSSIIIILFMTALYYFLVWGLSKNKT